MINLQNYLKNTYANRGMDLENDINITNKYYDDTNICIIYKKPTPIRVVNVDYKRKKINEAYYNEPSTLDYTGVYKGYYLEFDAKETKSETSFPISNIHLHQIKHIEKVLNNKGIAFLIVRFTTLNKTYLLMGNKLLLFLKDNTRKSIPITYFQENCYEIPIKYNPRVDYIKVIDNYLKKEGENND